MVMAALSMLFTQCRKTEPASPLAPAGDGQVSITLDVDGGNSKADVNTLSGVVTFKSDDVIYVASNGAYVGYLTYSDGTSRFEGTLTNPTEGQPLYFYFLGNKGPATANLTTGTIELTADISDQSDGLPVISGAKSEMNYTSDVTGYSARLLNKCALVKFDVQNYDGDGTVSIIGTDKNMKNKVTVDLGGNSFSYNIADGTNNGKITLNHKSGSEYWAILLPQEKVNSGPASFSDGRSGAFGDVPKIECNAFLTNAIKVYLTSGEIIDFSINEDYETSNDLNFSFTIKPNAGCVIDEVTLYLSFSNESPNYDSYDRSIDCGDPYNTGSISKYDLINNPPFYEESDAPIYIRLCAKFKDSGGFCGEPVCVYSDVIEASFEFGEEEEE